MLERLQKIISRAGIASRRHAEQLIESGQVRVNGHVITELGTKANASEDRIEVAGKVVQIAEGYQYLILHKPPRVVSTLSDPEGRPSLMELLRTIRGRVYPVGRLDYAASGLLLLTSDGELTNRILKAADKLPQTYWFKVKGRLLLTGIAQLQTRLHAKVHALKLPRAAREGSNPWYEITLSAASRDALRRLLFDSGHPVEKLRRVAIGPIEMDDLPEGEVRSVDGAQLSKLKQLLARIESPRAAGSPRVSGATQLNRSK
jgi:23S rRNA pseudouridine2605 synthase